MDVFAAVDLERAGIIDAVEIACGAELIANAIDLPSLDLGLEILAQRLQPADQRFAGVDGSAYIVGGFGMTALTANNIVLVPIRSGIGLRLGANIGYLKYTPRATWNPF